MTNLPATRISNKQRETTIDILSKALNEGYITFEEWETRLDACNTATSLGEINDLTKDLPKELTEPTIRKDRYPKAKRALCFTLGILVGLGDGLLYPSHKDTVIGISTILGMVTFFLIALSAVQDELDEL